MSLELLTQIEAQLTRCWYTETAIAVLGIPRITWHEWVRRGRRAIKDAEAGVREIEDKDQIYVALCETVSRCRAVREGTAIEAIYAAGEEHWQARAWIMERSCPERWGLDRGRLKALEQEIEHLQAEIAAYRAATMGAVAGVVAAKQIEERKGDAAIGGHLVPKSAVPEGNGHA